MTATNQLSVPEIVAYSRQPIEGGALVSYLMRQPGATVWEPVKFFTPERDAEERIACRQCGDQVPRRQLSDGICQSCFWPSID